MPLHDWNELKGWDGVHHLWITEMLRWVQPRLPEGYRAYIGSAPLVAVEEPEGTPDVSVRKGPAVPVPETPTSPLTDNGEAEIEADEEIAVATLDPTHSLFVARKGWLIAAVEIVSPRNKDRNSSRAVYTARYAGYLLQGVHLLLVDVHPRPYTFSFADSIARALQYSRQPCPAPHALAYCVGGPHPDGGSVLILRQRSLQTGVALPTLPLPLNVHESVKIDLEQTYSRAAASAYLT